MTPSTPTCIYQKFLCKLVLHLQVYSGLDWIGLDLDVLFCLLHHKPARLETLETAAPPSCEATV